MAEQIYSFINGVSKQVLGIEAVTAVDTGSLVSLGRQIMSTEDSISKFYSVLAKQIGRTYVSFRALPENRQGIMRTPLEFGGILRTLELKKIARTKTNDSWNNSNPINIQAVQDTTDAVAEYFEARGTFQIETKVIYDFQLREAFADATSLGAFVDMIFQDMYNGMELAIRDLENTTICTAMALAASSETEKDTCINLLALYNTAFGKTLTAAKALRDADFLRFACAEIKHVKKNMEEPSVFYNPKGYERWTPSENCMIQLHERFAANLMTYLQSDTYHRELVTLPSYKERPYWQGIGDNSDADRTKIAIDRDDVSAEINGVIAFVFDSEAAAITVDFVRTKSHYYEDLEHTEYYHKADWASIVRGSQQMVVFYIDDYAPIPVGDEPADWATNYTHYYTKNLVGEYTANASSTFDDEKQYYKKIN